MSRKPHCFCLLYLRHSSSQYLPSTFTAGLKKNSSVQPSFETATDTISDEENVGQEQAFRSDVALLRIARRVDAIVLQVDWRRYSEHFFVREDEVDSMFRELLKRHGIQHD